MADEAQNNQTIHIASDADRSRDGAFLTTQWSLIVQAGQSGSMQARAALEELCQIYWYPLYVHVRRLGWGDEDSKDLTQQFFARFLENNYLKRADPERGRFRSYLLTSLKHFLTDEWEKLRAQKRGGGQRPISWEGVDPEARYLLEPTENLTPDRIYEKRWAAVLLDNVLKHLRDEQQKAGRAMEFDALKSFVWGDGRAGTYAEVAARLKMEENSVKVAIHRLRRRFRELLRLAVLQTVSTPAEVDAELLYLRSLLSN